MPSYLVERIDEPASNVATFRRQFEVIDDETGDPIDVSSITEATFEISDRETDTAVLTATLSGGSISVVDTYYLEVVFTAEQMTAIDPKYYGVYFYYVGADGDTYQVMADASLQIYEGK